MTLSIQAPSVRAVLGILSSGQGRTHKELTGELRISPRTVRYALKQLKDRHLLIEKMNLRDARQIIYVLRPEAVAKCRP